MNPNKPTIIPVRCPIELQQFLKLANLTETGGQVRTIITAGGVKVDGVVETRRAKKLNSGAVVEVQIGVLFDSPASQLKSFPQKVILQVADR